MNRRDGRARLFWPRCHIGPGKEEARQAVNHDELREFQAPLKARYRDHPETALVTLRASGDIDSPDMVCKVDTGRAWVEVSRRTT